MYYAGSVRVIRERILGLHPTCKAKETELRAGEEAPFTHILWMCDEIEKMNTDTLDGALKASRWIGWIFAHMEFKRLWDNNRSRDLIQEDEKLNFDLPLSLR